MVEVYQFAGMTYWQKPVKLTIRVSEFPNHISYVNHDAVYDAKILEEPSGSGSTVRSPAVAQAAGTKGASPFFTSPDSESKPKKSVKHLEGAYHFGSAEGCKWTEEACLYSHRKTGIRAGTPAPKDWQRMLRVGGRATKESRDHGQHHDTVCRRSEDEQQRISRDHGQHHRALQKTISPQLLPGSPSWSTDPPFKKRCIQTPHLHLRPHIDNRPSALFSPWRHWCIQTPHPHLKLHIDNRPSGLFSLWRHWWSRQLSQNHYKHHILI